MTFVMGVVDTYIFHESAAFGMVDGPADADYCHIPSRLVLNAQQELILLAVHHICESMHQLDRLILERR